MDHKREDRTPLTSKGGSWEWVDNNNRANILSVHPVPLQNFMFCIHYFIIMYFYKCTCMLYL